MYKQIILFLVAIFIFTACSSKDNVEYNKPAIYWYNKMLKQISRYQLDAADDTYTSLEAEHRNSPLLESATLIIAQMHMQEEEYMMANYYYDEYLKKASTTKNFDYVRYLKVKSKFLAFKNQFRDQELLYKTIKESKEFVQKYPHSQYIYLVQTIYSRLLIDQALFEENISQLYTRVDKPKASKIYHNKATKIWHHTEVIKDVDVPFYRAVFE